MSGADGKKGTVATNALSDHMTAHLEKLLREHRVVVFYDPRSEFAPFVDELEADGAGLGGLPRVRLRGTAVSLARFEGSFFALKLAVEPLMEADQPEPLMVYVAGAERDREGSVLMELEKAGRCYEPQLRRLARNELRQRHTDGDIDQMLAPETLTYHDVVRFLSDEGDASTSLLKLALGEGSSEVLLARWLATPERDSDIEARVATGELYRLVQSRLGLPLAEGTSLARARHAVVRYVLVNEFRGDLQASPSDSEDSTAVPSAGQGPRGFGASASQAPPDPPEPPACLDLVPKPPTRNEKARADEIALRLRTEHGDAYVTLATDIEKEFDLPRQGVDPSTLGSIDTFPFEERALLEHAAGLVAEGRCKRALVIVGGRRASFWLERNLARLAQWEACRLMADLAGHVARVRPLVASAGRTPREWVEAYASDWFAVDRAQRALETWVSRMEDEPEGALERALGLVRRKHEELDADMAEKFTQVLSSAHWSVPGMLHQTRIYPEYVTPGGGRVAYFMVDAFRFEMAADLVDQLEGADGVRLLPAVAALPSITPVGMAALLPGADADFSVVEARHKLAVRIGSSLMANLKERKDYLKSVRPEAQDIDLGTLLQKSSRSLGTDLGGTSFVVVRSQAIDGLGELDGGLLARQIVDTVVGNIARGVRKLAALGFERFVITADHGHQFSMRRGQDMIMDRPGGDTIDEHRRCWIGRGGQTPSGASRVTGTELGYDTDLDFIFPKGLAVLRCGGDLAFHHGGTSLQEMVIPVVVLRMARSQQPSASSRDVNLVGVPRELTNRTFGLKVEVGLSLLSSDPLTVRLLLLADGQEVGRLGLAADAVYDRQKATVTVPRGETVSVAMLLSRDVRGKIRVVAQDPATDALLAQSEEIQVKLGV